MMSGHTHVPIVSASQATAAHLPTNYPLNFCTQPVENFTKTFNDIQQCQFAATNAGMARKNWRYSCKTYLTEAQPSTLQHRPRSTRCDVVRSPVRILRAPRVNCRLRYQIAPCPAYEQQQQSATHTIQKL